MSGGDEAAGSPAAFTTTGLAATPSTGEDRSTWEEMADELRVFLDNVASLPNDAALVTALTEKLEGWNRTLAASQVRESEQVFGRLSRVAGRGQTMSPRIHIHEADANSARGTVRFGRYFLGRNGAAHGGAIPLVFDEVMGRLANTAGRPVSRTAYLKTDYRSITPIDVDLSITAWFEREEGRKRVLRAELRNGGVLCAEAEGLFVALRDGQP